jgi:hypothetical protein
MHVGIASDVRVYVMAVVLDWAVEKTGKFCWVYAGNLQLNVDILVWKMLKNSKVAWKIACWLW